MSATVAERLISWFVAGTAERAEEGAREPEWIAPTAVAQPTVAVLAARRDAAALGAAVGLGLRGCVLVCTWLGEDAHPSVDTARVPATPAARRLAERLTERGLDATPAGRLVRLALPGDELAAARDARLAAAAADSAAVVLALGGARGRAVEELLAEQDRIVVVARRGEEAFAALAAQRIAHPAVSTCAVDPTPAGRALALAGAWVAPCLRGVTLAAAGAA